VAGMTFQRQYNADIWHSKDSTKIFHLARVVLRSDWLFPAALLHLVRRLQYQFTWSW